MRCGIGGVHLERLDADDGGDADEKGCATTNKPSANRLHGQRGDALTNMPSQTNNLEGDPVSAARLAAIAHNGMLRKTSGVPATVHLANRTAPYCLVSRGRRKSVEVVTPTARTVRQRPISAVDNPIPPYSTGVEA